MFKAYEEGSSFSSNSNRKKWIITLIILSMVMIIWWIRPSSFTHSSQQSSSSSSSSSLERTSFTSSLIALKKRQKSNDDIILGLLSVENLNQIVNISDDDEKSLKTLPTYWIMAKQWICGLKKNKISNFVLFVFVEDNSIALEQGEENLNRIRKRIYSSLTDIPLEMITNGEEGHIITFTPKDIPQLIIDYMEETKQYQLLDKNFDKFYKNFKNLLNRPVVEGGGHPIIFDRELFTKHWEFVTLLKPIMVWKCVKHFGFNVFFTDLDVVLFQNPTEFMRQRYYPAATTTTNTNKFDIIFQIETCGTIESLNRDDIKINTGVYYVKSEMKSIQFLETWMKPIMMDILTLFVPWVSGAGGDTSNQNNGPVRTEPTNDQAILNALVTKLKKEGKMEIVNSIGYLPVKKFPNKCQYTSIVGPEIDENGGKHDMVLFHINGVWMSRQKLNYLRQREHFYLDSNNKCQYPLTTTVLSN